MLGIIILAAVALLMFVYDFKRLTDTDAMKKLCVFWICMTASILLYAVHTLGVGINITAAVTKFL